MESRGAISKKLLLSLAAIGSAAAISGLATFATFTSSTSVSHGATTGTVVIGLGTAGTADNRLSLAATDVAPGDTIERQVKLSNTGTLPLSSITLSTTATTSSVLDTDATNGLQMVIDKCSVAWTESGVSPAFTYTCSGTTTSVLASRAVIGTDLALSNLSSTTNGSSDHLRVKLTLPTAADNTFQNKASTIQYAFTGTQRAATSK